MNLALPILQAVAPNLAEQRSVQTRPPALWQGAWVGWLTCQVVLLLLVEDTSLAQHPWAAFSVRVALVSGFVWVFARPCFAARWSRSAFLLTTLSVEAAIGMFSHRLSSGSCWTLLLACTVTAVLIQPPTRRTSLWALEGLYSALERLTRVFSGLPRARWFCGLASNRWNATTLQHLWAINFDYLERHRQRCAHAVNRRRRQLAHL